MLALFDIIGLPDSVGLAVLLVSLYLLFFTRPGPADPSCARCGYGVRGLPTVRCPECGSDLNVVGIRPEWLPLPLGVRVAAMTVALLITAVALSGPIDSIAPKVWDGSAHGSLNEPASGRYLGVDIRIEFGSDGWWPNGETDRVILGLYSKEHAIRTFHGPLRIDSVIEWMSSLGFPVDRHTEAEAADIVAVSRVRKNGPRYTGNAFDNQNSGMTMHRTAWKTTIAWFWPACVMVWFILWRFGLSVLARRDRARRTRRPTADDFRPTPQRRAS